MKAIDRRGKRVLMILPSLRISGGVKEALRLANDLHDAGVRIVVLALWRTEHELTHGSVPVAYLSSFFAQRSTALLQFPILLARFIFFLRWGLSREERGWQALFLTHFSTFPFAWVAPRLEWYCFNQDVEWMFVREGILRSVLRRLILFTSRKSNVYTTNEFVESLYKQQGIQPSGRLSIWSPREWLTRGDAVSRPVDVAMLVRRGAMKRSDLCFEVLRLMKEAGIRSVVITPDSDLFEQIEQTGVKVVLRPTDLELRTIYRETKIFLLLSDTEGFALPPLEAMGSGCVPLCRDSGGPRCYMTGPLAANLIPLGAASREIVWAVQNLLSVPSKLNAFSATARMIFAAGLAKSDAGRMRCIEVLAGTLRGDA